jgi:hypothetical protein
MQYHAVFGGSHMFVSASEEEKKTSRIVHHRKRVSNK